MLKLRDLAERPDFEVGGLSVSPSRRRVKGPAGEVMLEPLIMQVFLLLLGSAGRVVTRDELFDQCWGGVMVGDDSLNRAIAKVRRIANETAPGLFEIETIPRTGYRMTGRIADASMAEEEAADPPGLRIDRRMALGGAAAVAAAAVIGAAGWWTSGRPSNGNFAVLLDRGEEALRMDDPRAETYFAKAVELEPDNARAWGLLAYSRALGEENDPQSLSEEKLRLAERAVRSALDIDPKEPDALLARALLQSEMLDWAARENALRQVLTIAPDNVRAMRSLAMLLHSVGRCREALELTDKALALHPLTPDMQGRKALRLWVLGQNVDADRVIDRALELWPSHRLLRLGRLMIYAFTGRAPAALAMVDDEESSALLLSSAAASVWREALRALDSMAPADVERARDTVVQASRRTPAIAASGILMLSALKQIDAAFDVANGFLLGRGPVIVRPQPEPRVPFVNQPGWRNTFGLFTPPTRAMRLDPRFDPLTEGLGLKDYWQKRGVGPDDLLFQA